MKLAVSFGFLASVIVKQRGIYFCLYLFNTIAVVHLKTGSFKRANVPFSIIFSKPYLIFLEFFSMLSKNRK